MSTPKQKSDTSAKERGVESFLKSLFSAPHSIDTLFVDTGSEHTQVRRKAVQGKAIFPKPFILKHHKRADPTQHLNIAFFLEGMSTSGVDTSTKLLAEALRAEGHRVTFFAPWAENEYHDSGDLFRLPGVCVNSKQDVYWSYPLSMRLIAKFMREQYDLIHVHTSTSVNVLVWQISKLFDLPVVYTYHTMSSEYVHYLGPLAHSMGSFVDSAVKLFDRLICNAADIVITPSQKAADYLAEIEISPPVRVIPNGINLQRFTAARSNYLHNLLHIPEEQRIILFVGRLNQEKRPIEAYQAFRNLAMRRATAANAPDCCLVMVGHGPLAATIQEMAAQDGLANRVHLPGIIQYEQMPQVYQSADIWMSTSTSEVHPMVALEACACGLPSVVMADRALEGVICDGVNGFIVENERDMVDRLDQLLSNEELRCRMSAAAAHQAEQFSVEATAKQLCEVYYSVIEQANH